ncbi:MAG: GGDEF domain-containing protein [Ruminococcaceae bacterium]|nr:GGDEF domain-containing protein [Oscillospiraceae bacterium]
MWQADSYSAAITALKQKYVHPDDVELFDDIADINALRREFSDIIPAYDYEFRILSPNLKEFHWFSFSCSPIDFSEENRVLLLTMRLVNNRRLIALENKTKSLLSQMDQDPLTGLLNKRAAQSVIDEYISTHGTAVQHALLLCDVDNFKRVNDCLGHPFGDALLTDIASKLRSICRKGDIVCRIGGDEFIILLKNARQRKGIIRIAEGIGTALRQSFPCGEKTLDVSVSIGVAMFPSNGRNYCELYSNADKAMYCAKHDGKDRYCFFDDALQDTCLFSQREPDDIMERPNLGVSEQLTDYIFKILYNSGNLQTTIPVVLQLLGSHYNVSRVYFVQRTEDNKLKMFCQWTAPNIEKMRTELPLVPYLAEYFDKALLDENLILYCHDTSTMPHNVYKYFIENDINDIYSFMQSVLLFNDKPCGYIGFADCMGQPRIWTSEEARSLSYVSKLISLFLYRNN